ncbi:hypothetical protein MKEN_00570700 [Mycena kentingensis (nom. inval.)]|nr:hypothetical protein MKEN_00570700 [Mycena kentingensis (nom. inval.)]
MHPRTAPFPLLPHPFTRKLENMSATAVQSLDVTTTLGALWVGCLVSVALSAIVGFQTFLYFRCVVVPLSSHMAQRGVECSPTDAWPYRLLVVWIWLNDTVNTVGLCSTMWEYGILQFGDSRGLLSVPPPLSLNTFSAAVIGLTANSFYVWRITKMSQTKHYWLPMILAVILLGRSGLMFFSATQIALVGNWFVVVRRFKNMFTAALAVAAASDILISVTRYYHLRRLRAGHPSDLVDSVVVFTINDGLLTSALAIGAILCFLLIENSFIWMALYLPLAKLYCNSVLATLNLRNWNRHRPNRITLGAYPALVPRPSMAFVSAQRMQPRPSSSFDRELDKDLEVGVETEPVGVGADMRSASPGPQAQMRNTSPGPGATVRIPERERERERQLQSPSPGPGTNTRIRERELRSPSPGPQNQMQTHAPRDIRSPSPAQMRDLVRSPSPGPGMSDRERYLQNPAPGATPSSARTMGSASRRTGERVPSVHILVDQNGNYQRPAAITAERIREYRYGRDRQSRSLDLTRMSGVVPWVRNGKWRLRGR